MEAEQQLILASVSPRRRRLMEQLGLDFSITSSAAEEIHAGDLSAAEIVQENALRKARQVAGQLEKGLVIGADTLIGLGDTVFGKAHSAAEAIATLQQLSGKTHQVYTGVSIVNAADNHTITDYMATQVSMKPLTHEQIQNYAATGEPLGKAGAYAIQGRGELLIEKIDGCYSNVVGLPLPLLADMLLDFKISVL